MAFTESLTAFYADFGETVTVNSVAVTGLFDLSLDDAFGMVPGARAALRVPASVAAAVGQTVVRGGVSYTIAAIHDADFTGAEKVLSLK